MRPGLWTGFFLLEERRSDLETMQSDVARIREAGFPCGEMDERNAYSLFVQATESEMRYNAKALGALDFFSQLHAPKPVSDTALQKNCEDRIVEACKLMGIRTIVTHPFAPTSKEEPKKESLEYLRRYAEKASDAGLCLALENQIYPVDMDCYLEEVADLGVNIDFAHAVACGLDVPKMIEKYGSRLFGLHVSDSDGRNEDYHIMVGCGIVSWGEVKKALKKVGYKGDFHLEIVHERSSDKARNDRRAAEAFKVLAEMQI